MQALSSAKASGARAAARRPAFSAEPRRCRRMTVASAPATQPASTTTLSQPDQFLMPMWGKVKSEQEFFGVMKQLVAAGKLPEKLMMAWQDFYNNYRNAVVSSGAPGAEQTAAQVQATIADCVLNQFVNPYTFPSFHQRLLEPYNYYEFGQRYVGTLIDFDNSVVGHADRWADVKAKLAAKHNVILLANHQTEADPGVFAHMLADLHPEMATGVVYVAGDRVVTDAMCKPFSMGRNLFCVHSKKRMDDEPELKAAKMETNRKTLVAMQRALNAGGTLIWIAPSGGRDRPSADGDYVPDDVSKTTCSYVPDKFDPASVELMRNLVSRAKQPGHLYPLAMFSWPLMPPPPALEKALGERRITNHHGVGISLCPELDVAAVTGGIEDKEAAQVALAQAAHASCSAEYDVLTKAIKDPALRAASKQFSQPWKH